jgi:fimbrial chaperone protein
MNVWLKVLVTVLGITVGVQAQAGVIIGGTRLVYDGGKKESSLTVSNPDKTPFLIQSWVDPQDGDTTKAPFIITPPIFRLDGGQNNVLRVILTGGNLPSDKESLYWINIKSIPSAEKKDNTLQIAVKTRIKLIYRPRNLPGDLNTAASTLKWQRDGNQLKVSNASPYYITFFNVKVNGTMIKEASMVSPHSTAQMPAGSGNTLSWQIINDFGGVSQVFNARL